MNVNYMVVTLILIQEVDYLEQELGFEVTRSWYSHLLEAFSRVNHDGQVL